MKNKTGYENLIKEKLKQILLLGLALIYTLSMFFIFTGNKNKTFATSNYPVVNFDYKNHTNLMIPLIDDTTVLNYAENESSASGNIWGLNAKLTEDYLTVSGFNKSYTMILWFEYIGENEPYMFRTVANGGLGVNSTNYRSSNSSTFIASVSSDNRSYGYFNLKDLNNDYMDFKLGDRYYYSNMASWGNFLTNMNHLQYHPSYNNGLFISDSGNLGASTFLSAIINNYQIMLYAVEDINVLNNYIINDYVNDAYNEGYNAGYAKAVQELVDLDDNDMYDLGKAEGFLEGKAEGKAEGKIEGYNDAKTEYYQPRYDEGYTAGEIDGYNDAKTEFYQPRYDLGYSVGKSAGYSEGLSDSDANPLLSMLISSFSAIGVILDINILPGISIGMLILIPVLFGIISFIIGKRGGND